MRYGVVSLPVLTPTRARRLPFRRSHKRERHDEKEPKASPRPAALGGQGKPAKGNFDRRRAASAAAHRSASCVRSRALVSVPRMRTAIVSTYTPRACGIGAFAADLRRTLLGVPGDGRPTSSRSGSGSGRRRCTPSTAGCSSTTASSTVAGAVYRVGLALLDLDEPTRVVRRLPSWILAPVASYERTGDVPNVIFPCGPLHAPQPRLCACTTARRTAPSASLPPGSTVALRGARRPCRRLS